MLIFWGKMYKIDVGYYKYLIIGILDEWEDNGMLKFLKIILSLAIILGNTVIIKANDELGLTEAIVEEQMSEEGIVESEEIEEDINEEGNNQENDEEASITFEGLMNNSNDLLQVPDRLNVLPNRELKINNQALYGFRSLAESPYSFQFINPFTVIGAFYDATGAVHALGFTQVTKNYYNELEVQFLYTSNMYYSKDRFVEIQFYKIDDDEFYYDGYVSFDTYGENELILTAQLPYESYKNQEYLYLRIGTVNSYNPNYLSNSFDIKVYNPYYQAENIDTTPPIITLNGSSVMTIEAGETFYDPGASAYDTVDGAVSVDAWGSVDTSRVGAYTITYISWDYSGNKATTTRTVYVKDTKAPVITLNGESMVYVRQGSQYSERGASAYDRVDGNVNVTINGSVDSSRIGTYTLTYTATDKSGNQAKFMRNVKVIASDAPFTDVEANKWYTEHIMSFVKKQYINGYDDGTFKPQNPITRAEFVKIVNKAFGLTDKFTPVENLPFTDLDSEWKFDELKIALAAGYITPATEFRHNDPINRQEAAKIVGSLLNIQGQGNLDFTDADEIAPWAQGYVQGLVQAGVLSKNETFRPMDSITRAEAVKMLNIARGLQ